MKKLLLTAAAVGALCVASSEANAALRLAFSVGASTFTCADGAACDTNGAANTITLSNELIGGVDVSGTFTFSHTNPDILSAATFGVVNQNAGAATLKMAFGDNGFTGKQEEFKLAASGTWANGGSSDASFGWWVDGANALGASTSSDLPGTEIDSFTDFAATGPNAFSFSDKRGFLHGGPPFSMTEGIVFDLAGGASLVSAGATVLAIPELPTWAYALTGFGLLGLAGLKRRKTATYASL